MFSHGLMADYMREHNVTLPSDSNGDNCEMGMPMTFNKGVQVIAKAIRVKYESDPEIIFFKSFWWDMRHVRQVFTPVSFMPNPFSPWSIVPTPSVYTQTSAGRASPLEK